MDIYGIKREVSRIWKPCERCSVLIIEDGAFYRLTTSEVTHLRITQESVVLLQHIRKSLLRGSREVMLEAYGARARSAHTILCRSRHH